MTKMLRADTRMLQIGRARTAKRLYADYTLVTRRLQTVYIWITNRLHHSPLQPNQKTIRCTVDGSFLAYMGDWQGVCTCTCC
jgi:hypothetical protein